VDYITAVGKHIYSQKVRSAKSASEQNWRRAKRADPVPEAPTW